MGFFEEFGGAIGSVVRPLTEGLFGKPPGAYTADPAAFEPSESYMAGLGYLYDKAQGLLPTQAEAEGAAASNQAARAIASQAASTRGVNPALLAQMATTTQGRTQGDVAGMTAREAARERENALMMFMQGLDENRRAKIQEQQINAGQSGQAQQAYATQANQIGTVIGGLGSGLTSLGTMGAGTTKTANNKTMPKMDYGSVSLEGLTPNENRPQIMNKSMMPGIPGQSKPSVNSGEVIGAPSNNPYFNADLDRAVRSEYLQKFHNENKTANTADFSPNNETGYWEKVGTTQSFDPNSDFYGTQDISYEALPTSYFINPVVVPEEIRKTYMDAGAKPVWHNYYAEHSPEYRETEAYRQAESEIQRLNKEKERLGTPTDYLQNYYNQRRTQPEQISLLSGGR